MRRLSNKSPFDAAVGGGEVRMEVARRIGHSFSIAWGLMNLGRHQCILGLHADAVDPLDEGIRICERFGLSASLGQLLIVRGTACLALGEPGGESKIDHGLALWEQSARFSTENSLAEVVHVMAEVGRSDLAEKYQVQLERIYAETPERSHYSEYLRVGGLVKARAGDRAEAKGLLMQARALAHNRSALLFELRASRELVRLFGQDDDGAAHREMLAGVIKQFREGRDYPDP